MGIRDWTRGLLKKQGANSQVKALAAAIGLTEKDFIAAEGLNSLQTYYDAYMGTPQTRTQTYIQIDDMCRDSIVDTVLSMYADDTFGDCLDNHQEVWAKSKSEKIERISNEFLVRSGLLERLWSTTYYMIRYGDEFHFINGEKGKGITEIDFDFHPSMIKRYEKDGYLYCFVMQSQDGKSMVYPPWRFVHYRYGITQKKRALYQGKLREGPYGTSLLASSLQTWRKLNLMEDNMVMYRFAKTRRPFMVYIDVDGVPANRKENYIRTIVARLEANCSYSQELGIYSQQAKLLAPSEPVFMPIVAGKGKLETDDWSVEPNTTSIIDIEYMRNKLYGSFRIPPAYLGLTETMPSGLGENSLYAMSMRYARTVHRVKANNLWGLKRTCRINLAYIDERMSEADLELHTASVTTAEDLTRAETTGKIISFMQELVRLTNEVGFDYKKENLAKWILSSLHLNGLSYETLTSAMEGNADQFTKETQNLSDKAFNYFAEKLVNTPNRDLFAKEPTVENEAQYLKDKENGESELNNIV